MTTTHPIPPRGNYALLSSDFLSLILPQNEVGVAEYLERRLEPSDEPGFLQLSGSSNSRRFAMLSAHMTLLQQCPSDHFLAIPLGDAGEELSWCWKELKVLMDVQLQPKPIPAVLLAPGTPVTQYVVFDGKPAYLCTAEHLYAFVFESRNLE